MTAPYTGTVDDGQAVAYGGGRPVNRGGGPPRTPWSRGGATPAPFGVGGTSQFGADTNLLSTQINPTNSRTTNQAQSWTNNAGAAYNGGQFGAFQGVAPLDFSKTTAGLASAGNQMAGLSYNYGGANKQYAQGQGTLQNAGNTATGAMQGLQGMGTGNFSGGGASLAGTGAIDAAAGEAKAAMGGPFDYAHDTGNARAQTLAQLTKTMTSPDRLALAQSNYDVLDQQGRPGYEMNLRDTLAKNAAMGRRGAGQTTNELGDLTLARERSLGLQRQQLAADAAGQTLGDNLNKTTLGQGVTQTFGGLDLSKDDQALKRAAQIGDLGKAQQNARQFDAGQGEAAAGRMAQGSQFGANFQRGLANDIYGYGRDQSSYAKDYGDSLSSQEGNRVGLGRDQAGFTRSLANDAGGYTQARYNADVNERDAGRADEYGQDTARRSRFTTNAGYLGQSQGQDRSNRNELRGERDYQTNRADQATSDEMGRAQLEEQLRNGQFSRGLGMAGLGNGGRSPTDAYQNAAGRYGDNAGAQAGAVGDWMSNYFASKQGGGGRRGGAGAGTASGGNSGYGGAGSGNGYGGNV